MARKSSPTIFQDELYPTPGESEREYLADRRLVDLDVEEESPFLRGQKRVSARRGSLPKRALSRLKLVAIATFVLCLAAMAGAAVYHYGERNWRCRINSSDDIEISGTHNVPHAQVMEVLGGDIGRNIFFIPLTERKAQLEKIPWVESASVMRFVPNRLVVEIHERTPIAFARLGSRISLIDAGGTVMELPVGKQKYSFPVIAGINPGEPLSTRAARMKIYVELVRQLDSDGTHYSQDVSEIDLSDQDDVKVLTNDPGGAVLVHLGASDFLSRYKVYVTHLQAWRQQFDKLDSVDLRYDHQIIVNPDQHGSDQALQLPHATTRAAMTGGASPAALVTALGAPTPARPEPVKPVAPTSATTTPESNPVETSASPAAARPRTKRAKKSTSKRFAHRSIGHSSRVAQQKPSAAKTAAPQPVAKPAGSDGIAAKPFSKSESTTTLPGANASPDKKKPSPAVTKNSDQQDRP